MPTHPKVFGIGLNKTGTTTLAACGTRLGLRGSSYDRRLLADVARGDHSSVAAAVDSADLFEDWPWPLLFRHLDEAYPGSKFVLTTRSSADRWLASLEKHSLRTHPWRHGRALAYGYGFPQRRRDHFLTFYEAHNSAVREHFAGRPDDLLELCWEQGDGYPELCAFLGLPDPGEPVPHANRAEDHSPTLRRRTANRTLALLRR